MQRTFQLIYAAIALPVAVAACDKSPELSNNQAVGTQSANTGSACDILTKADAEMALGRTVERVQSDGGPAGLDICQYGYEGERLSDTGNVSVTLQPIDIGSLRKGVADAGFTAESVNGLGDEAFWSPEAGLHVGKGNRTAIYLLAAGDLVDPRQRSIELAHTTIGRL